MFLFQIFVMLLASVTGQQAASSQTADESVRQVEQRFTDALLKRDHSALDDLLGDDLIHIGFEGQIAGKAEYMTFFKQGSWQYEKYKTANVKFKDLGTVAVVTGQVERSIVVNNKRTTGQFAFTHVWLRTEDRWRLTSSQVTTVPNTKP
jgi:ketosteroid isomerase-like protein